MVRLIDTHQHLVYPDVAGYGWTDGIPALADKPFPVERYAELTAGGGVTATLFMETGVDDADYKAEARFVADLATSDGSGIAGIIASCRPEEDAGFTDWLDECAGLGVVGYRRILHVMPDDLSTTDTFRRNVSAIGARGLPFDLCLLPKQLRIGLDLVGACDNTAFVLNHCGVPDIAGGGLDPWREDMAALAGRSNVVCKLSGLLAYCAPDASDRAAIQPYIDHVLEVFGPDRMVWGSDWPVVDLGGGLPKWLDVTQAILSDLSADEADAIGWKTAARVYGVTAG
ncbi:amidohydrolase family protein [Alphaproteobacteria bacterium GH1-50]|uniref:Amidohydrolase family protein n=1 Tax=Kangsaoukella pontilimi TaxID=2691042 RepID=A0A7C9IQ65_9RHOB|nr:amidohydrolase [Kangsaoukella pontilimi]MXQ07423.1 amidohydrolase family protein [Kangsaoukella pontilimi]